MKIQAWHSANSRERMLGIIAFTWIAMIGSSFAWNWYQSGKSAIMFAEAEAHASYGKDLVYRRWTALQGGVYVPPSETTPANPYLSHLPDRDLVTTDGKQLTLINPAYMTRQVHALGKEQYGVQGHITSLKPLNPSNLADPWETQALNLFAAGRKEVVSRETMNGQSYLRFMSPLITEKPCLKCHAAQGFKEGDIRGGISVSVPFAPFATAAERQQRQLLIAHLLMGCLGLMGLWKGNALIRSSEVALSKSEEQQKSILHTAMDGFWVTDIKGRLLEVNHTYRQMSGYSIQELLTMHISELEAVEAECDMGSRIQQIIAQKEDRFETKHRRKDGSIFDIEISIQYRPTAEGQFIAFLRDITERKRSEQTIIENEQRLRTLINSTPDILCFKDSKGRWLEANETDLDLFSLTGVDYHGKTDAELADCTAPIYRNSFLLCEETDEIAWQSGGVLQNEEVIPRPDGTIKIYDVIKAPIFEADGTRKSLVVLGRDITARKRAEVAMQLSEERFRTIFEESPIGIAFFGKQHEILLTNRCYREFLGYSEAEIIERGPMGILHPDDRNASLALSTALRNGEIPLFHMEQRYLRKDRIVVWADTWMSALHEEDGQLMHTIGWVLDITERKLAEEEKAGLQKQLVQAQKMEAIGTLAGGIAHDFNNILGGVLGYAEMARDASPTGSEVAKYLEKVLSATHRAASLVKQILTFSRQNTTERILLEPAHLIKEDLKLLRPILPSSITINQQFDTTTSYILADPTQIHQVVMNLCTNAFHAMEPTGGTLDIILRDCELSREDLRYQPEARPGKFVLLSVSDTGPGIAPEIWGRIFEPFFTTKEVGKGTGMGLSITQGIVTSYNGFLTCESEPGQGTVFRVYFPAIDQEIAAIDKHVVTIPTGKERILFIDDENMLAELGKTMLEHLGYEVTIRKNSIEALTTFQNHADQFDVVITDQTMPGMTGIDLARKILQIRPDLPIILCTGYSTLVNEEQAKAIGIKGFIMKPLSKQGIATLLRTVLDNGLPV